MLISPVCLFLPPLAVTSLTIAADVCTDGILPSLKYKKKKGNRTIYGFIYSFWPVCDPATAVNARGFTLGCSEQPASGEYEVEGKLAAVG